MPSSPNIPTLIEPVLIDKALEEIQTALAAKITWFDHIFGKAILQKEEVNGQVIKYPAVYAGGKEYRKVFPDGHLGNFCFFDVYDTEELDQQRKSFYSMARFGFVVWFDYRKVYPADWEQRTIENIKLEILQFWRTTGFSNSMVRMNRSFERSENIYRGYTDKEVERQFLMRPFGGLRLEGEMKFWELQNC